MENSNFKKTVFGGFDRQEVMEQIEQISEKYKAELEEVSAQKAKLQSHIETLTKDYNEKIEHIKKLQQLVIKQNADNDRLKQLNISAEKNSQEIAQSIAQNNEKFNLQIADLTTKISELSTQNSTLTEEKEKLIAQINLNSEKIKRIDEAGFTAEKLVSEAQFRSTQTLSEANNKVSAILQEAAKKAKEKVDSATLAASEIIAKAHNESDRIKSIAQDYNQQTKRKINDITSEISEKEKKASIRSAEIVREANIRAEEIVKSAKKRVQTANKKYDDFIKEVSNIKLSIRQMLGDFETKMDDAGYAMPDALVDDELFAKETPQELDIQASFNFEQQINELNNLSFLDEQFKLHTQPQNDIAPIFENNIVQELDINESNLANDILRAAEEMDS